MLDDKLFPFVDDEVPQIKADTALAQLTRGRYQDLSASYKAMKDLYPNTNRPADQYASQVQSLRTKYLRLVESLQKDLKIDVPPNLLAILKATWSDGQSTTLVAQIVPAPVQTRLLPRPRQAVPARRDRVTLTGGLEPCPVCQGSNAEPARPAQQSRTREQLSIPSALSHHAPRAGRACSAPGWGGST